MRVLSIFKIKIVKVRYNPLDFPSHKVLNQPDNGIRKYHNSKPYQTIFDSFHSISSLFWIGSSLKDQLHSTDQNSQKSDRTNEKRRSQKKICHKKIGVVCLPWFKVLFDTNSFIDINLTVTSEKISCFAVYNLSESDRVVEHYINKKIIRKESVYMIVYENHLSKSNILWRLWKTTILVYHRAKNTIHEIE